MSKFMFVYRDNADAMSEMPSPEEMQAIMEQWNAWFDNLGDAVIDRGDALLPMGKQLASDGTVTDGPFIEAKELVGGYSIVESDSFDGACELAKACPHLAAGGSLEVRQVAGFSE